MSKQIREALEDCIAFITGQVSGPAQRDGIVKEAIAALQSSADSEPIEALRMIQDRLNDLREANDTYRKDNRDKSADIQRNDREIRWLTDIRSVLVAPQPLRTEPQTASMREALADVVSHRETWRSALLRLQTPFGSDDDGSYWDHELKAFDRTFAALATLSAPAHSQAESAATHVSKAANNYDALVDALAECAAPFSTSPGSVAQCQTEIGAEFQRRMDIAWEALSALPQQDRQEAKS